ncbi:sterol desaturase family protein [Methylocystis echinoides]|uniref:sterol desaturase family protein n=1 Tax=Methylocystis echinoides TaxID=29468 RepID=UPI003438A673
MSAGVEGGLLVMAVGLFVILLLAEKMRPYKPVPTSSLRESFTTNASAFLFNNLVLNALSLSSLFVVAQRYGAHGLLHGLQDGPLKWALSFVFFDFAVYCWHFLGHKSERLWRLHKVHHSDKNIHVSTGLRFHVLDQLLEVGVKCIGVLAIGVTANVVVVCEIIRMFFVFFHHANVAVPGERWLSYLVITPSLHRVHHSTRRIEHDSNYGIVLAIWDMIFGTRKELAPEKFGLENVEATNILQLFSLAFVTEYYFARVLHLLPRAETRHDLKPAMIPLRARCRDQRPL